MANGLSCDEDWSLTGPAPSTRFTGETSVDLTHAPFVPARRASFRLSPASDVERASLNSVKVGNGLVGLLGSVGLYVAAQAALSARKGDADEACQSRHAPVGVRLPHGAVPGTDQGC